MHIRSIQIRSQRGPKHSQQIAKLEEYKLNNVTTRKKLSSLLQLSVCIWLLLIDEKAPDSDIR